jgi:hypothetical protein
VRARPGRGRATRTTSPVRTRRSTRLPRWFDTRSSRSSVKTTLGTMGTSPFKMCHAREPRKEILGEIGFVPRAPAASETEIMNLGLPLLFWMLRHNTHTVSTLQKQIQSSQISFEHRPAPIRIGQCQPGTRLTTNDPLVVCLHLDTKMAANVVTIGASVFTGASSGVFRRVQARCNASGNQHGAIPARPQVGMGAGR